jgi:DNA-binding transcriptional MocR family regulator
MAYRSIVADSPLLQKKEEEEHAYLFQYGITSGLWEFREELAKFLSAKYGDTVHRYINIYHLSPIF